MIEFNWEKMNLCKFYIIRKGFDKILNVSKKIILFRYRLIKNLNSV